MPSSDKTLAAERSYLGSETERPTPRVFNLPGSGSVQAPPPARNEREVFRGHLLKECLVLALWKRPKDRRGLLAGVPVFAAADPDGPRKGGTEPARNFSVAATVGETAAWRLVSLKIGEEG